MRIEELDARVEARSRWTHELEELPISRSRAVTAIYHLANLDGPWVEALLGEKLAKLGPRTEQFAVKLLS